MSIRPDTAVDTLTSSSLCLHFEAAKMESPVSSPSSSPSPRSDSDSDTYLWPLEPELELKSVIARTSEFQLRSVMDKLVGNPIIRRAIARELSCKARPTVSPVVTPRRRKSLHKKRPSAEHAEAHSPSLLPVSQPSCVKCHKVLSDGWVGLQQRIFEGPCVFHPGTPAIETNDRPSLTSTFQGRLRSLNFRDRMPRGKHRRWRCGHAVKRITTPQDVSPPTPTTSVRFEHCAYFPIDLNIFCLYFL